MTFVPTPALPEVETVDVIIPVRNEENHLQKLLDQLKSQTRVPDRIYVVVAPSDDRTWEIAQNAADNDSTITLLNNPNYTAPHAMNLALDQSTSDAWIRIDGHTEVPPNLVEVLLSELNTRRVACVGPVLRSGFHTPRQYSIGRAMASPFGVGNAKFRTGAGADGPTDTVAFGMYVRAATEQIGRFETNMVRNQDDQFNTRLRAANHTIYLTSKTHVTYFPRSTYKGLWHQYHQYGYWRFVGSIRYGNQLRWRQAVPVTLVSALAISSLAAISRRTRKAAPLAPFGYGMVLISHLVRELRLRAGARASIGSTLAIATMHIAYGIGSVQGILACLTRRRSG